MGLISNVLTTIGKGITSAVTAVSNFVTGKATTTQAVQAGGLAGAASVALSKSSSSSTSTPTVSTTPQVTTPTSTTTGTSTPATQAVSTPATPAVSTPATPTKNYQDQAGNKFNTVDEAMASNANYTSTGQYNQGTYQNTLQDVGQAYKPGFQTIGTLNDLRETLFTHPFQSIEAALDPNSTIADLVVAQQNKSTSERLADLGTAGVGYIGAILTATAAIAGVRAVMAGIGTKALTAGGAEALATASTKQAAVGVLSKATPVAGQVAVNTATKTLGIKALTNGITVKGLLIKAGGLFTTGMVVSAFTSGGPSTDKEITTYIEDSGMLAMKLRQAGLNTAADELYNSNKDLRDGLDIYLGYIPIIGEAIEKAKINAYRDRLNEINNQYEELLVQQKAVSDMDKLKYEQQKTIEQRLYDAQLLAEKREYEEAMKEADRQYAEEQALAKQAAANAEAEKQYMLGKMAETESVPGSTLGFGLLSSGGETIPANDSAKMLNGLSNQLYGKDYEGLTAEQAVEVDKILAQLLEQQKATGTTINE
jgi:hypothetical protein